MAEDSNSLEFTPTWVVAVVCSVIVLISFCAQRSLHKLGKLLKRKDQDSLCEALEKLKEELMLLGFISLLLTVFQDAISHICIPSYLASYMLPCKKETVSHTNDLVRAKNIRRQLLSSDSGSEHCSKGKAPFLSLEAMHQLHIFIFVLAVVHVIFCAITMFLGGARMRQWKHWEDSAIKAAKLDRVPTEDNPKHHHHLFLSKRAFGYWRKSAVVSWLISFFKQFYNSVTKSDFIALRQGFVKAHRLENKKFSFHKYVMRNVEADFKKVVGISWYLWLFLVIFLLLNLEGWHTYFWLAFLPLILLLLVGAKLEHIIYRLAQDVDLNKKQNQTDKVKPSDEYFWFGRPGIVLDLIHFILFQNAFEIAFFVWIWCTYGFRSCIMEKLGYIIPRIFIGVIVQVLCSYSTLPLYALVTQMGSQFKFDDFIITSLDDWAEGSKGRGREDSDASETQMQKMTRESYKHVQVAEEIVLIEAATTSITHLPFVAERHTMSP
ncbi:hypothetical protein Dsin_032336 [Dipteronia sinensis]|uniref:MLO-like protein n=1 Tax=Dipteronia sinensis TaxID=43782 RepID=A0AAD9ZN85_9ROSI|nr:hypothetical protein Dsin_032336 [Dipteronia sinensis]